MSYSSVVRDSNITSPLRIQRRQASKTLIMGDSILGRINKKGLKNNVEVVHYPGAKIDTVCDKKKLFKHVVLYVGGNKATNSQVKNETYECYEERLNQLISYIKTENAECDIFICNMCPRSDKKMLELINGNTQPEMVAELVMDAFKLLSLNIKLTNMNKLERVKKELHAKYVPLCEEGTSAAKLLGDHFQEQAKLESTKQSLTKNATRFFREEEGEKNNQSFRQGQYSHKQ